MSDNDDLLKFVHVEVHVGSTTNNDTPPPPSNHASLSSTTNSILFSLPSPEDSTWTILVFAWKMIFGSNKYNILDPTLRVFPKNTTNGQRFRPLVQKSHQSIIIIYLL